MPIVTAVAAKLRDLFLDGLGGERVHLFVYLDLAPELSAKGQWRATDRAALDAYCREQGFTAWYAGGAEMIPPRKSSQ